MPAGQDSFDSSSDSSNVSESGDQSTRIDDQLVEGALPNTATDDPQMSTADDSGKDRESSAKGAALPTDKNAARDNLASTSDAASGNAAKTSAPAADSKAIKVRKLKSPSKLSLSKQSSKTSKFSTAGVTKSTDTASKSLTGSRTRSGAVSKVGSESRLPKLAAGTTKACSTSKSMNVPPKETSRSVTKSSTVTTSSALKKQVGVTLLSRTANLGAGQVSKESTATSTRSATLTSAVRKLTVSRTPSSRAVGAGTSSFRGPSLATGGQAVSAIQLRRGSGAAATVSKDGVGRQSKTPTGKSQSGHTRSTYSTGAIPKVLDKGNSTKTTADRKKNSETDSPGEASKKLGAIKSRVGDSSQSGAGNKAKEGLGSSLKENKFAGADQKAIAPGHYKKRLSYNAPSTKGTKPATKSQEVAANRGPGGNGSSGMQQNRPSDNAERYSASNIQVSEVFGAISRASAESSFSPAENISGPLQLELRTADPAEILERSADLGGTGEFAGTIGSDDHGPSETTVSIREVQTSQDTVKSIDDTLPVSELAGLEIKGSSSEEVSSGNTLSGVEDVPSYEKKESMGSGLSLGTTLSSLQRHSADETRRIKPYPFPQRQGLLKHGLSLSVDQIRRGIDSVRARIGSVSAEESAIPSPVFDQSESIKESPSVSIETDNYAAVAAARRESVQPTQACEFPLALDASEASSEATMGIVSQETKTEEQTPKKKVNLLDFLVRESLNPSDTQAFNRHKSQIEEETRLDVSMMGLLANHYRNMVKERDRKAVERLLEKAVSQSCSSSNLPSSILSREDSRSVSRSPTPKFAQACEDNRTEDDEHTEPPESATESIEESVDITEGGASAAEGGASAAEGGAQTNSASDSTTASSDAASHADNLSGWSDGSVAYDVLYNFHELHFNNLLATGEYREKYLNHRTMVCEALALLRCDKENEELAKDALRVLGNYVETDFCYFILKYATEEELQLIKETATPHQVQVIEDKNKVKQFVSDEDGLVWE